MLVKNTPGARLINYENLLTLQDFKIPFTRITRLRGYIQSQVGEHELKTFFSQKIFFF